MELLAGPAATSKPVVLAGDFNSAAAGGPDSDVTYDTMLTAGFDDAWNEANPGINGFTCCQAPDLLNTTSELSERIDLVLTRGSFTASAAELVNDAPVNDTQPFWASDHAGVISVLQVPSARSD